MCWPLWSLVSCFRRTHRCGQRAGRRHAAGGRRSTTRPLEQATLVAGSFEVQQGLAERSIIRLTRQLRFQLSGVGVDTLRVRIPDGELFYELPSVVAADAGPAIANRLSIEHELREIEFLEFGTMLSRAVVGRLEAEIGVALRVFGPDGEI